MNAPTPHHVRLSLPMGRSVSHNWPLISAILMGDHVIPSSTDARLPFRVTDAPAGTDALCLNETMRIKRLDL